MPADSDRNLLLGILALQMDFVTRDALVAAMNAWVLDKAQSLGHVLLTQQALDQATLDLLEALVQKHLQMHAGDPSQSLASISSLGDARNQLQSIADPQLQASLVHVPDNRVPDNRAPADLSRTRLLETPALETGRFRILRPHARGGLGEVFVARDEELGREVALKQIQTKFADRSASRSRFLLEAEITGGLEHPGIVPVYGLGSYADGRPYYAMRFIRGDSLQEAIERFHKANEQPGRDASEQTVEFRKLLGRLIDVCNAIEYAHSRGVLHRDLKPGNIMLGRYGETLVVDWGLAKTSVKCDQSESSSDDEPLLTPPSGSQGGTIMGSAIGTPGFMSPEQTTGRLDLLGPTSDVYSLGATLYYLLTGRSPFALSSLEEIFKRTQAGDFPTPRSLVKSTPPALEAICLKGMALKPADRYPSPRALADDLEHWLADEPISARQDRLVDRIARITRRHRATSFATAVALVLLTTVSAIAAILIDGERRRADYNAHRADQNAAQSDKNAALAKTNEAQAISNAERADSNALRADEQSELALETLEAVVFEVQTSLKEIPAARKVRQRLLDKAIAGLDRVGAKLIAASEASRSSMVAHFELADIFLSAGATPRAAEQLVMANGISRKLAAAAPNDPQSQHDLANSFDRLGDVTLQLGDAPAARQLYELELKISRPLAQAAPSNAAMQRGLLMAFNKLARVMLQMGDTPGARELYGQSLEIANKLALASPDSADAQRDLGTSYNNLARATLKLGDAPAAIKLYQQDLEITRKLALADPQNVEAQRNLSTSCNNLGEVTLGTGDTAAARKLYEESLKIRQQLAPADPENVGLQRDLSNSYDNLGDALLQAKDVAGARKLFDQSLEIRRKLALIDPQNTQIQRDLAITYGKLGDGALQARNAAAARKYFEQGWEINRTLALADPKDARAQRDLGVATVKLGSTALQLADAPAARKFFEQGVEIHRQLALADPDNAELQRDLAISYANLANVQAQLGDAAGARTLYERDAEIRHKLATAHPKNSTLQAELAVCEGQAAQAASDDLHFDLAQAALQRGIETLRAPGLQEKLGQTVFAQLLNIEIAQLAEMQAAPKTIESLDTALAAGPRMLVWRTRAEARQGHFDAALETVEKLAALDDSRHAPEAAVCYALGLTALQGDRKLADFSAEERTLADKFAARCLEMLAACKRQDLLTAPSSQILLRYGQDFAALRQREDFQKLLAELPLLGEAPASP